MFHKKHNKGELMLKAEQVYPSDLTDQQWDCIKKLIPKARAGGRPRTTEVRAVMNAIFYINRTGCAWRYLPKELPPWQSVYTYFSDWTKQGILNKIHIRLVRNVRILDKRGEKSSILIVDSQSAKAQWGEDRGFDGFKKVRGRKRNIFVDSLGLIHSIKVDAANKKDHRSAIEMLNPKSVHFPNTTKKELKAFLADGGYRAIEFHEIVEKTFKVKPTLKSSAHQKNHKKEGRILVSSNLKPTRWIVERTFAWFNYFRRLSRDFEKKTSCSEAMIQIAMMQIMLKRLYRVPGEYRRWQ